MNEIVIKQRKLKEGEISLLMDEISRTPFMIGYTKRELQKFPNVFVAEYEGEFAGVCANIGMGFNWVEVGPILVLEKFRGLKIGKQLFEIAFDAAVSKQNNIYMVSLNPIVKKWMQEREMTLANHVFYLSFIIIWHDIKMFFSLYRILEYFRKSFLYRGKPEYIYGFRLNPRQKC